MSDKPNAVDRFFDALADALRNHEKRREFLVKVRISLGRLCWLLAVGYVSGLILGLLFLEYFGDRFWWSFPFLYAPPAFFVLPVPIIAAPCLFFARKALALYAFGIIILAYVYVDYELPWPRRRPREGQEIRLLTNNIGQKNRKPLTPFVERIDPHIIALQDAARYGPRYAEQYAEHHVVYHGEFIIASLFPVLDSGVVHEVTCEGSPCAAWADVNVGGTPIRIVNVHIRTPRKILGHLMGLGYIKEFLRAAVSFQPEKESEIRSGVRERMETSKKLGDYLDTLDLPVIILGDFNFPNHGWQFHRIRRRHTDAFEKGGKGYGFTFPGRTSNPLAFFRPWLRLDHVFASTHFKTIKAEAETDRESQHRAMAATLLLTKN